MEEKTILFYTRAYNSETTISRCIESILSQTIRSFKYIIIDNGSTDNTREIIKCYSSCNDQIVPLCYDENKENRLFDVINTELKKYNKGYLCTLDADDEYLPDFLGKMISFIEDNNLEVATCGSEWIDAETGEIIRHKVIDKTLLLEGQDFAKQFPKYRNHMVTIWGAAFSFDLLRRCDFDWAKKAMNFSDTAFCMEAFRRAKRAGVLAHILHKYYISHDTSSYRYNPNWFKACKYLFKISEEYLLDYGAISKQNQDYLWVLFFILLKYIIPRIQKADVVLSEKLKILHEIFSDVMTKYVLKHWERVGIYSSKQEFLNEIRKWLFEQEGWETHRQIVENISVAFEQ